MAKILPFGRPSVKSRRDMLELVRQASFQEEINIRFVNRAGKETGQDSIQIDLLFRIEDHLNCLRGHISQHTVGLRGEGLKAFPLQKLREMVESSNKSHWGSKPAFYRALVDEIRFREQQPT